MGYSTDFSGSFGFSRELTNTESAMISNVANERHGGNLNHYPGFPGFWCQWITDGKSLYWDGGEKFYEYVAWLEYLIQNFFNSWGVKLNGEVCWQGEEIGDVGKIVIENNKISTKFPKW